ncbi:DNA-3-methyladenine glycosylase 2 family protein [Shewanella sp. KT0246]|uniref:DNA-3-methyladenine glycosylase 2 family protein n=1 Tax=Shewanella sp. KT0246 TaxID=2815912 RepID=UPI001BBDA1F5|nr:Ada metal-binding domain-containing protein [Shewanella sp. KT0246]GIU53412.1 alcohol dehydrogenase [Shewanella sp. KT0246]
MKTSNINETNSSNELSLASLTHDTAPNQGSVNCHLSDDVCRQARLSRDARFDGRFFIGVKTTGIFCRSICPASPPKEQNVVYFDSAIKAAEAGLRPCLRCRPDSAPQSNAWQGTSTSLQRAIRLIDGGCLSGEHAESLTDLSSRLGISSRYLSQLFNKQLGTSPKKYALYRQLMFAKQLLHQTQLSMTDVAMAAGFNSIRRFNEVFKSQLQLTPSQLRRSNTAKTGESRGKACSHRPQTSPQGINLLLDYRPPFQWLQMWRFYQLRAVEGMEWLNEKTLSYGRSFTVMLDDKLIRGTFEVAPVNAKNQLSLNVQFEEQQHIGFLYQIVQYVRKLLDLDADMDVIEAAFEPLVSMGMTVSSGLRIPATASVFEAGCRAVLGQQVSVIQASKLLNVLAVNYGDKSTIGQREVLFFPTPKQVAEAGLDEFKMPGARKRALKGLGQFVTQSPLASPETWIEVKGIGPWTIAYAQMRGESNPNIFLGGDLVIKNRVKALIVKQDAMKGLDREFTPKLYQQLVEQISHQVSPWGSYLTFQLWKNDEN